MFYIFYDILLLLLLYDNIHPLVLLNQVYFIYLQIHSFLQARYKKKTHLIYSLNMFCTKLNIFQLLHNFHHNNLALLDNLYLLRIYQNFLNKICINLYLDHNMFYKNNDKVKVNKLHPCHNIHLLAYIHSYELIFFQVRKICNDILSQNYYSFNKLNMNNDIFCRFFQNDFNNKKALGNYIYLLRGFLKF